MFKKTISVSMFSIRVISVIIFNLSISWIFFRSHFSSGGKMAEFTEYDKYDAMGLAELIRNKEISAEAEVLKKEMDSFSAAKKKLLS